MNIKLKPDQITSVTRPKKGSATKRYAPKKKISNVLYVTLQNRDQQRNVARPKKGICNETVCVKKRTKQDIERKTDPTLMIVRTQSLKEGATESGPDNTPSISHIAFRI